MIFRITYVVLGIILGGLTMAYFSTIDRPFGVLLGFLVCSWAAYCGSRIKD